MENLKTNQFIAEFTDFKKESNWVSGRVGRYTFEAKLFDEGSYFGIENGRVSKLTIYDTELQKNKGNSWESAIVNYDRGWDIKPNKIAKPYFQAVMKLLENSPKRFND